jgi:starch synthase
VDKTFAFFALLRWILKTPMKILMIATEVAPFAKTGGLGDVVGALSKELAGLGHEVRVVCPLYGFLKPGPAWRAFAGVVSVHLGLKREEFCRVWQAPLPGANAEVNFIEFNRHFGRIGIYGENGGGYADNPERFVFLTRAALDWCLASAWIPDVVHAHDWPAALAPVYLNTVDRAGPLGRAASVFTIHNLEPQGYAPRGILDFAGLPAWLFSQDNLESYNQVNFMKGGLYHATKITTVSRHYAQEIQTPDGGFGLQELLRFRAGDLIGVTNGIDVADWNPATDPHLPARYSPGDLSGKVACKTALQQRMGLNQHPPTPIFAAVARLYPQKGLDLLAEIVPELLKEMDAQFVVLGAGDAGLSERYRELARHYPGRVGAFIGYDERLAHLIEAGADFFVMPSRFEPCGLNQMYSQAYGTPPIVRATGGLVDTVDPYQENSPGQGTGFVFKEPSAGALHHAIQRAYDTYTDRPADLLALRLNGMKKDFSWTTSTRQYVKVYEWALGARRG